MANNDTDIVFKIKDKELIRITHSGMFLWLGKPVRYDTDIPILFKAWVQLALENDTTGSSGVNNDMKPSEN